jgi:tetratricopeptide (TPR) repeat protein
MRPEPAIAGILLAFALTAATNRSPVTFSKDVLPILEKNCQSCHRPGEAAPFSLLTYEQARPWAVAMKEAVLLQKMPPWFADPHYGKFANDRSLSTKDIFTLVDWADMGAPQGDPKDAPAALHFIEGWRIPKPDVVIEMPNPIHIPASGTIEYQHVVVPTGITEDRWVQFAEARPGNPALVHHIVAFIREPGSKWLKDAKPGVPFVPGAKKHKKEDDGVPGEVLTGYAPGLPAMQLQPGQAILIKAGSDIVFQVHYTANGKAGTDRSRLGLVFTAEPPKQRVYTLSAFNDRFKIPAGDADYRVDSEFEMGTQVELTSMQPHMHSRGKDFEFRVIYPTGKVETLLRVPNYSFSWQLAYYPVNPIVLPKGTKIECIAHFDNSPNNPNNPDPSKDVSWGDQSRDEMMIGFFSVAFDANVPLKELFPERKKEDQPLVKSQKELDAVRAFQAAKTPDQQIQAIENVLTKFPDTGLKVILLQNAMGIEQRKGDFAQVVFYGERLLDADPRNAFALVTMAGETARHIREFDLDKVEQLAKVDKYAKAGLDAAKAMPKSRADMTDEYWEAAKQYFQSLAYEAMGQAAGLRKKYDEAVVDYKQAISISPTPDASAWIGLGKIYEDSGKLDDAGDAFDKALATPNISPSIKSVAQAKKDEVAKRKSARSNPPSAQ